MEKRCAGCCVVRMQLPRNDEIMRSHVDAPTPRVLPLQPRPLSSLPPCLFGKLLLQLTLHPLSSAPHTMLVVRAVHTFVAEHGDELEFQAGEDVEILEKDDAFGDGWWRVSWSTLHTVAHLQGRNARGEEGLFPATYIAEPSDQAVPPDQTVHSPHKEVEIADPPAPGTGASGAIVDSHQDLSTSDSQQNGVPDANNNPSEEPRGLISAAGAVAVGVSNVMGKTIGEIQDAIESIAKPDSDDEGQVGIGHGARARLAAQAKLANEHRERQRSNDGVVGLVYSDDSEDEDEDARRSLRADANGLRNGTRGQPDTDPEQIPRNLVTSPAQSASSAAILQPALPLPVTPPTSKTESNNISQTPAYQWNVDQVASWAESKGFDDTICQKFRGESNTSTCHTSDNVAS